jgi:hypothetical protein
MLKNKTFLFLIVVVLLSLGTYLFFHFKYGVVGPVFLYLSYLMFAGLSILSYNLLDKATKKKGSYHFVNTYLGITAIKMFLILVVLTIYLFFNKTYLFQVGIFYALAYLLFLAIDVMMLLKMIKTNNTLH